MRTVTLLDTAVASNNLGDQIIMEAVRNEIDTMFPDAYIHTVATHERMGKLSRALVRQADWAIAGGTNLIASHMWIRSVWNLSARDALASLRITLMGVGWYQYQRRPDFYTRWLLGRTLSKRSLHGVRDSHALEMLAKAGFANVMNVGCPTLWSLTPARCAKIPCEKADSVVTAVTSYLKDPEADRAMLAVLRHSYGRVRLWVQTLGDLAYARSLGVDVELIPPSLRGLDTALTADGPTDYVGNRLHAGIRAMQHGCRSLIVEVDNRARSMAQDFGLPTVARGTSGGLHERIHGSWPTEIHLPQDAIDRWRAQFLV